MGKSIPTMWAMHGSLLCDSSKSMRKPKTHARVEAQQTVHRRFNRYWTKGNKLSRCIGYDYNTRIVTGLRLLQIYNKKKTPGNEYRRCQWRDCSVLFPFARTILLLCHIDVSDSIAMAASGWGEEGTIEHRDTETPNCYTWNIID